MVKLRPELPLPLAVAAGAGWGSPGWRVYRGPLPEPRHLLRSRWHCLVAVMEHSYEWFPASTGTWDVDEVDGDAGSHLRGCSNRAVADEGGGTYGIQKLNKNECSHIIVLMMVARER